MTENKPNRGAVRIDSDVMDLIVEEQSRLRKREGKKPPYSEILRRMWASYSRGDSEQGQPRRTAPADPAITPANEEERKLVAAFLRLMRDDSELAKGSQIPVRALVNAWKPPQAKASSTKRSA